ncbi:hypothetical protein JW926_12985 [Candidatus Sumerlaeota bacterium]|nr:hypothetical protein [Candidatus Sumerlaeota bacterium]
MNLTTAVRRVATTIIRTTGTTTSVFVSFLFRELLEAGIAGWESCEGAKEESSPFPEVERISTRKHNRAGRVGRNSESHPRPLLDNK